MKHSPLSCCHSFSGRADRMGHFGWRRCITLHFSSPFLHLTQPDALMGNGSNRQGARNERERRTQ